MPATISYQGVLSNGDESPVQDGTYELTFAIHDAAEGGIELWTETQSVTVVNGIFNVILGTVNPLQISFDQPYWLAIQINNGQELTPRIELTASPYSLHARSVADSSITTEKLADGAVTVEKIAPPLVSSLNNVSNDGGNIELVAGANVTIMPNDGDDTITISATGGQGGDGLPLSGGTMTGPIDNVGDPPITMGKGNFGSGNLNPGLQAFVAGSHNRVRGEYAVVSGGGGEAEADSNSASGNYSAIGGGLGNLAIATTAVIAGGENNQASGNASTVGGGFQNNATGIVSTIGGGIFNAANGTESTIAGGRQNTADGDHAVIGGGEENTATGPYSSIGGGNLNQTEDEFVTIGGGQNNLANEINATVSGGANNQATGGSAVIGGGENNRATGVAATVAGGFQNSAGASSATVGGGIFNNAGGIEATISGGRQNQANASYSSVAGGRDNVASGLSATIPGGRDNAATGDHSFAAGQRAKANHNGTFVWADATAADFTSTNTNQFLIRASGGVGIGSTNPAGGLLILNAIDPPNGLPANNNGLMLGIQSTSGYKWIQSYGGSLILNPISNNVGIGVTTPGNILTVRQNSSTDPIADAWTTYSSRRWKTNIQTIDGALDKVSKLRGVTYEWKQDGKHDIGLIAEEVGEVIPEVVAYEENGVDAKSVDYARLVALLIEAIKEQKQRIEALEARLALQN